jgi:preprotein translocase subunit SecY
MQALLNAIAQMPLVEDAQRVFHGRGGMYPGCEQWSLDWFAPVWVLTSFKQVDDEELAACQSALESRWQTLAPGQPVYVILYAAAIIFFCFFYTALVFNSRDTADNLKKSGAFVPGIRPGDQTARYIDKILVRLTLGGAIYMVLVCLLPEFLVLKYNVPFYFGGTSLLIIVVVAMDFMSQVQSFVMQQQYGSLMKKANFKMGITQ